MRPWVFALVGVSFHASAALAGGLHAKVEGPGADGITYTACAYSCEKADVLEPWAIAEGLVDGKRRSVLIRLEPTDEHGVYRFARTWPLEGRWTIRYMLGHPPAPATVVTLRSDGTVKDNRLYYRSDGTRECGKVLLPKGDPRANGDGC